MTTMLNNEEIDWENIFNFDDGVENLGFFDATSTPFPTSEKEVDLGDLEGFLMKDDDFDISKTTSSDYFKEFDLEVCDLLLDSPPPSSEPEVVNVDLEDKNSPSPSPSIENGGSDNIIDFGVNYNENNPNFESNCANDKSSDDNVNRNDDNDNVEVGVNCNENSPNFESNCENDKSSDDNGNGNDDDDEDPQSKKRKRQLRNRDAAMRSRERKKMLVKDLEMKSRYFEEECRRLQRLLHCCYAENQWLRCSLQTYGAPMTKPESAVLLPESLLLGSLVWLMVNICLLPQPKLSLLNQDAAVLASADRKILETAALRGKGTKISELWITLSFTRSKRCKASKTKMKPHSPELCF